MLNLAIIYIIISAVSVGFMSQIRKIYQVKSGTGLISTVFFCDDQYACCFYYRYPF